jgi:PPOX class probable F420-dependent enzyme
MANREALEAFLLEPRTAILAGIRKDGRPHLSPNWFSWDGEHFYVSTTKKRVKYAIFRRDPRIQMAIDDSMARRTVLVDGVVEIREDIASELPRFRTLREKYGVAVPSDEEFLVSLTNEDRILLVVTPNRPLAEWTVWGLD